MHTYTRNQCAYVLHRDRKTHKVCLSSFRILLMLHYVYIYINAAKANEI